MQPITLTNEQRQFRSSLRQFCEDKIAPRAAEITQIYEGTNQIQRVVIAKRLLS